MEIFRSKCQAMQRTERSNDQIIAAGQLQYWICPMPRTGSQSILAFVAKCTELMFMPMPNANKSLPSKLCTYDNHKYRNQSPRGKFGKNTISSLASPLMLLVRVCLIITRTSRWLVVPENVANCIWVKDKFGRVRITVSFPWKEWTASVMTFLHNSYMGMWDY